MSNLKLWDSVSTTPSSHIQIAKVSGQNRKTVKAVYQKEKATEVFGIQGIKWGVVVGSEDFHRVHIDDGEILLQYTAVMFFIYDGERGEIPIAAAIKERQTYKRNTDNEYQSLDNEAIKKVRTDAMTKGLSELGFNADIFKGYHDQNGYADYADGVLGEEAQERADKKEIEDAEEYAKWKEKELDAYKYLSTVKAISTAHTGHIRKATKMNDKSGIKRFAEAKDARIEELKEKIKEEK